MRKHSDMNYNTMGSQEKKQGVDLAHLFSTQNVRYIFITSGELF